jgi:hypothetical protein
METFQHMNIRPTACWVLSSIFLSLGCGNPNPNTDAGIVDRMVPEDTSGLPTCTWPDGGAPPSAIDNGRIQTTALCNFCHQDIVPNSGVFAGQLTPRPSTMAYGANLTPDRMTGIGNRTDNEILRSIRTGIGPGGRPLCQMRPFGADRLPDETLCNMLAYLRSLEPAARAIPASMCTQ